MIMGGEVTSSLSSLVPIPAVEHPTSPITPNKTGDRVASSAEVRTAVRVRFPSKPSSSWSLSSGSTHQFFDAFGGGGT